MVFNFTFLKVFVAVFHWCTPCFMRCWCYCIQGVGYLNARGIIHKDLKSKNVFLEDGQQQTFKVVISDFGLFSVTKLCQGSRLDCIEIRGCLRTLYRKASVVHFMNEMLLDILLSHLHKVMLHQSSVFNGSFSVSDS